MCHKQNSLNLFNFVRKVGFLMSRIEVKGRPDTVLREHYSIVTTASLANMSHAWERTTTIALRPRLKPAWLLLCLRNRVQLPFRQRTIQKSRFLYEKSTKHRVAVIVSFMLIQLQQKKFELGRSQSQLRWASLTDAIFPSDLCSFFFVIYESRQGEAKSCRLRDRLWASQIERRREGKIWNND